MMAEIDILNGFVGKVISDCIDITVEAIKRADQNKRDKNQSLQTRIYQVMVDALNVFPYNKYKQKEQVYDAAESILKGFKSEKNAKEAVRMLECKPRFPFCKRISHFVSGLQILYPRFHFCSRIPVFLIQSVL